MRDRKKSNFELGRIDAETYRNRPEAGLALVLDNIRSAHNVGSALRSADAFGVDKVWLCGISATPPSVEIHKSALGAEYSVPWEHVEDTVALIDRLQAAGWTVLAVEQTVHAQSLETFTPEPDRRYALVFGNEVFGVQQEAVDACDAALEIPQQGTKHSLNVSVSVGVVLWHLASQLRR